ncbi:MAG: response regulator [Nitrospirales bacterium]|nr:response regulator [Nitrospira sp.]MDR4503072.1 response regulator [Nitrospirales bacterium]
MSYRLLLIEDDPEDVLILKRLLQETNGQAWLQTESTVEDGLLYLQSEKPDVILLDLFLPDSRGLDTFQQLHDDFASIPIIVLTGHTDEELGVEALKIGAQDFLTKGDFNSQMLGRSIRYAIERHQLKMLAKQRQDQAEAELQALFRLVKHRENQVTTEQYAEPLIEDSSPALFHHVKHQFVQTLERALEEQKYKTESQVSSNLNRIAQRLGTLHAGPRDVVNVYRAALQELTTSSQPEKARAYVEEGRMLVLRLMGEVLSYYRRHSLKHLTPAKSAEASQPLHHSSR